MLETASAALIVVLIFVALIAAVAIAFLPPLIANSRNHRQRGAIHIVTVVGWFFPPIWLIALIWACIGDVEPEAAPTPAVNRPGRYELVGVDRESGLEVRWRVDAMSEQNARAKGELEGVLVTAALWVGESEGPTTNNGQKRPATIRLTADAGDAALGLERLSRRG